MRRFVPTRPLALAALLARTAAAQPATFRSNFGGLVVRNAEFIDDPLPVQLLVEALRQKNRGKCGRTAESYALYDGVPGFEVFRKEATDRGLKYEKVFHGVDRQEEQDVHREIEVFTLGSAKFRVHGVRVSGSVRGQHLTVLVLCPAS